MGARLPCVGRRASIFVVKLSLSAIFREHLSKKVRHIWAAVVGILRRKQFKLVYTPLCRATGSNDPEKDA